MPSLSTASTAFVAVDPTTNQIKAITAPHRRHLVISTSKGFIVVHMYRLHCNILSINAHLHSHTLFETILSVYINWAQLYFTAQQRLYYASYCGNFNRPLMLQAKYCGITSFAVDTMCWGKRDSMPRYYPRFHTQVYNILRWICTRSQLLEEAWSNHLQVKVWTFGHLSFPLRYSLR